LQSSSYDCLSHLRTAVFESLQKKPLRSNDSGHPCIFEALLGITTDSNTIQRFISHGLVVRAPLARALVKYGWSGQVAASGLEMTGVVLGMYGLHRMHHRWIERLLPVGVGVTHGILAYNNATVSYRTAANPTPP